MSEKGRSWWISLGPHWDAVGCGCIAVCGSSTAQPQSAAVLSLHSGPSDTKAWNGVEIPAVGKHPFIKGVVVAAWSPFLALPKWLQMKPGFSRCNGWPIVSVCGEVPADHGGSSVAGSNWQGRELARGQDPHAVHSDRMDNRQDRPVLLHAMRRFPALPGNGAPCDRGSDGATVERRIWSLARSA